MEPLALIGYFLFFLIFFVRQIRRLVLATCAVALMVLLVMVSDGRSEHAPAMAVFFGVVVASLVVAELIAGLVRGIAENHRAQRNMALAGTRG